MCISILYFRISHNTLCLPPKFCINHCFQMLLGICSVPKSIYLKTIVCAKFGGQTKCIMGNSKIENEIRAVKIDNFLTLIGTNLGY